MFNLYIDVLVDSKDPRRFKLAGFSVVEEPLLSRVFVGKECVEIEAYGARILMPTPQLLMEMKIKSFPDRTKDDKRTKDLADICALLLYSGHKPPPASQTREGKELWQRYCDALTKTTKEEWDYVANALDVSAAIARRTANLIRPR